MDELFKKIIIGEKEIKELEDKHSNMNYKVQNTNDVAKYFLRTARRKYKDEKIKKKDLNKLLEIYNELINENKTIKKYIRSKDADEVLLKDAEHIIKLFIDDYVKSLQSKINIWSKEVKCPGFVEPLLIILIGILEGILFIGNLYLMI